jgi:hypothetical protein
VPDREDDSEEDDRRPVFRDGAVHVMSAMCSTCIFSIRRPVAGSRVAELVRDTKDVDGGNVPCHHTTYGQSEAGEAVCRGWYDRFATSDPVFRLAAAMDVIVFQDEGQ